MLSAADIVALNLELPIIRVGLCFGGVVYSSTNRIRGIGIDFVMYTACNPVFRLQFDYDWSTAQSLSIFALNLSDRILENTEYTVINCLLIK